MRPLMPSSTFIRVAVRVRQDGHPKTFCPAKGSPTKPSLFSEMTKGINLRMVLLPTNPGTRNSGREIGRVPPKKMNFGDYRVYQTVERKISGTTKARMGVF
jgi:hypothetical protein